MKAYITYSLIYARSLVGLRQKNLQKCKASEFELGKKELRFTWPLNNIKREKLITFHRHV